MKNSYTIAVLPGDGIGPEIMAEAVKILKIVGRKTSVEFSFIERDIGGIAIDNHGVALPEQTLNTCLASDAVFLGSVGGPQWDHLAPEKRPEIGGLLSIRKKLGLYANLRPVYLFKSLRELCPVKLRNDTDTIDLITIRELSSDCYFGEPRGINDHEGYDTMLYRTSEVQRIAALGFTIASQRKKILHSIDKANVLMSSLLWRKCMTNQAQKHPDITLKHMYVDNAAMQLILNPHQFDCIVTTNLFGDILTDESAALAGSLGMLPSASLGSKVHLYEQAGGSAPDIAGKGVANPIAQILSAALMLKYSFDLTHACEAVYKAIDLTLSEGYRTKDISEMNCQKILSTQEMGDRIASHVQKCLQY